jgi:hypothetical protein
MPLMAQNKSRENEKIKLKDTVAVKNKDSKDTKDKDNKNSKDKFNDNDWKFHVRFAPAVSWAPASGNIKSDGAGFSFDITVNAEKYFREKYAFFIGVSYIRLGGKFKNISKVSNIEFKSIDNVLEPKETAKYAIQYVTIPVGLKLLTPKYRNLLYYFQGGLLPGFKVGSSIKLESEDNQSFTDDLNLMTCGVQLSAGGMYPLSDSNFIKFGLNFNRFFTDALSSSDMKIYPTSLGAVLGFVF